MPGPAYSPVTVISSRGSSGAWDWEIAGVSAQESASMVVRVFRMRSVGARALKIVQEPIASEMQWALRREPNVRSTVTACSCPSPPVRVRAHLGNGRYGLLRSLLQGPAL